MHWTQTKESHGQISTRFHLHLMQLEKCFGYHFACLAYFSNFALGYPSDYEVHKFQVRLHAVV